MITKEILKPYEDLDDCYETSVKIMDRELKIIIDPDDADIEDAMKLANKVLADLQTYEAKAREKIIEDYLDVYNDNWTDENNPKLNEQEFSDNLTLTNVSFGGEDSIEFFYAENDMFGGHSLIAISFDGETFEDVTLFG